VGDRKFLAEQPKEDCQHQADYSILLDGGDNVSPALPFLRVVGRSPAASVAIAELSSGDVNLVDYVLAAVVCAGSLATAVGPAYHLFDLEASDDAGQHGDGDGGMELLGK
jgi:hypothetical protein